VSGFTVKVPVAKVIKALEEKLTAHNNAQLIQDDLNAKYDAAVGAWKAKITKAVLDLTPNDVNIRTNYYGKKGVSVEVNYDLPKAPDRPERSALPTKALQNILHFSDVDTITNAIRILKMTEEETVNASTFKAISKFL
jgi:hypothetical protein